MMFSETRFSFSETRFPYLDKFLLTLAQGNIFSICVRDIKTKRVYLNNALCGELWGLPGDAMHGMTAREVFTRVKSFVNMEEALANIDYHDRTAILDRRQSIFRQLTLSYDGFVQIHQVHTIPLSGLFNRFIALGGLALDMTRYVDPLRLLTCYRYYYPKRAEAALRFFTYFGLSDYFYQVPSYEELRLLVVMMKDARHRSVGEALGISPKTVANYLASVRNKLKGRFEVYQVVSQLRTKRQWFFYEAIK